MELLRLILFPVSLAYGILVFIYHKLYDTGILRAKRFNIPVIVVGNLTVGGTGKSPMVEYIVRLLKKDYENNIATLSRGYGRSTSGFIIATPESTAFEVGDEPRQFKRKFPEIMVAVDNKRARGIKKMLTIQPALKAVVLDDGFQHRAVKAGISILLIDYRKVSSRMMILPTGDLREWKSGANRADIIAVTNTPSLFSPMERRRIEEELQPSESQKLYFSFIKYGDFIPAFEQQKPMALNKSFYFERKYVVLLLTGIANPSPLEEYMKQNVETLEHVVFSDHHEYSMNDIQNVIKLFDNIASQNKIIVTTEKDAMRLAVPGLAKMLKALPVFYIPIEVNFHNKDTDEINTQIRAYVRQNQNRN